MSGQQTQQLKDCQNEVNLLRCKLEMKSKALLILSEDLMNCRQERDQYKALIEKFHDKDMIFKSRVNGLLPASISLNSLHSPSETALTQLVSQLRQKNNSLMYEIEELRMKLYEAEGDIKILRHQVNAARFKRNGSLSEKCEDTPNGSQNEYLPQDCLSQIEFLKKRVEVLEKDLQSVLDEKEELVVIRDAYKAKVDRLNEKLNQLLRVPLENANSKIVDIDSLITENKFLYERINQMEEEKEMFTKTIARYRSMLEKGSLKKNIFNLKGRNGTSKQTSLEELGSTKVISTKEVQAFIATNNLNNLVANDSNMSHLKSLVLALFEALSDKSSALSLQRKTNKLLGKRIQDLEAKIKELNVGKRPTCEELECAYETSALLSSVESTVEQESAAETSDCTDNVDDETEEIQLPEKLENLVRMEIKRLQETDSRN